MRIILTRRESQVAKLIARGTPYKAAAMELGISENTIDRHSCNLRRKIGGRSTAAIVHFAIREGLVAVGECAGIDL